MNKVKKQKQKQATPKKRILKQRAFICISDATHKMFLVTEDATYKISSTKFNGVMHRASMITKEFKINKI